MSSILDALKRLEKEEAPPSGPMHAPSWLDKPEVDPALSHRVAGFFLRRRRLFWICCMVLIAAAAAALLAAGGFFHAGEKAATVEPRPPAPGASMDRAAANDGRAEKAARRPINEIAVARAERVGAEAAGGGASRSASKWAPAAPKTGVRQPAARPGAKTANISEGSAARSSGVATSRFQPPKTAAQRTAPSTKAAVPAGAAGTADSTKKEESVQAPPAADFGSAGKDAVAPADSRSEPLVVDARTLPAESGFQLQAISWSDVPEKRIAVVNGRILKEGDRIAEYVLSEIYEDDVVFRHSGQRWKLGFQPR